jgi:hypothetical protein
MNDLVRFMKESMDAGFYRQDKYGDLTGQPRLSKRYKLSGLKHGDLMQMAKRISQKFRPVFAGRPAMAHLFSDKCYQFAHLFSDKTGAAGHHHNFIGGLAVHTFEMLEILYTNFVEHPERAQKFNTTKKKDNLDFDWGVCAIAILYHDWGKLKEYDHSAANDKGRFAIAFPMMQKGHIFMSTEHFARDAREYRLEQWDIDRIEHAILSHHSYKDWGSPVEGITPEARIVAACDMISAERAKGMTSYFYDFVKGSVEYDDAEEIYNDLVAPRHQEMKDERARKRAERKAAKAASEGN